MNRLYVADPALADHRMRLLDNRVEAPVVSHHHRHIGRLGVLYQGLAFSQIVCKRFFNQNRNAGINAQPTLNSMKSCRCREDDAVRPIRSYQFVKRVEMGHSFVSSSISAICARVGNSAQFHAIYLTDCSGMAKSYQPQAGYGDAQRPC